MSNSVEFCSIQDGVFALGDAHMRSPRNVRLIGGSPFLSPSFFFIRQAIDGVMPLALCPQLMPQAPQHFRDDYHWSWLCFSLLLFSPTRLCTRPFAFTSTGPTGRFHLSQWRNSVVKEVCVCVCGGGGGGSVHTDKTDRATEQNYIIVT